MAYLKIESPPVDCLVCKEKQFYPILVKDWCEIRQKYVGYYIESHCYNCSANAVDQLYAQAMVKPPHNKLLATDREKPSG